uniref:Uncharacterized protein n=1 Tax=Fagus sylvatica TaxID=28930 RepID=A0A2N9ILQ9_FAGSY
MQGLLLWTPCVVRSPLVPLVSPEAHRRAAGGENPKWPLWPKMVENFDFFPKVLRVKPSIPLCSGINEPALFPRASCLCQSSEDATKSSTSPTSTDQILGFVDGNPKTKRKEMKDRFPSTNPRIWSVDVGEVLDFVTSSLDRHKHKARGKRVGSLIPLQRDVNTTVVNFSSLMPSKNLCVKTNMSKVNLLSTSIQGNNVHIDKGKSMAYPIEEPAFSYKEILKKEPPKPRQENSEDDTICERCSHILAKCFVKTKEKDNERQHELGIGVEALEYLKGPYIQKKDTTNTLARDTAIPIMKNGIGHKMQSTITKPHQDKEPKKTQNDHKRLEKEAQDNSVKEERIKETPMEDLRVNLTRDEENIDDIENIKGIEDIKDTGNIEGIEDIEDIKGIEDFEGIEDIEDLEGIEETKAMECTETDEVHEPENGQMVSCNAITLPKEFMATSWVQREEDARQSPSYWQITKSAKIQLNNDCVGIVKFTGIDQNGNPPRVTVGPEKPLTMEDLFKLT